MKIDFANLQHQYQQYKNDIDKNIQSVLDKSNYIMGEEIQELELKLEEFSGVSNVITCSNGTDALILAMMAIDIRPGDEIITTPFTFISTAETIALLGAKPVFVDIDEDTYLIDVTKIEAVVTSKTKAIIPVSLYGQPADMLEINLIAKKYNLKVIIDGAQCFGSNYNNSCSANSCDIYTTSFFPAKPLGCYGDGGAVFTNNSYYADKIRMLRTHGQNQRYHHKYIGIGGRLDTIQAAILLAKIPHYDHEIKSRNNIAEEYTQQLQQVLKVPYIKPDRTSVWAQYTIRVKNRDDFQGELMKKGIPTSVHYPIPLHLQECFSYLDISEGSFPISEKISKEVISLPMNPFLTIKQVRYIVENVKALV
jgi:UDP-2-acetamido-2-deoxy-ribo-hexuluronate aminotransferase